MRTFLLALALVGLQAAAQAEMRHFRFVGTVAQSLPMAPAGAKVSGRFSYNTATAPSLSVGEPSGDGYGLATYAVPRRMTMSVNGHRLAASAMQVEVTNNTGGNVEDAVSVYGTPMTLDGTLFPEGLFGLFLASGPGQTQVLRSTRLPWRLNVAPFDGMNYGVVQVNGSADGTWLVFAIDSIVTADDRDED